MQEYCVLIQQFFNHKQVTTDSFKHCELTIETRFALCSRLKPAKLVILRTSSRETGSSWDFWGTGTYLCYKKNPSYLITIWKKKKIKQAPTPSPRALIREFTVFEINKIPGLTNHITDENYLSSTSPWRPINETASLFPTRGQAPRPIGSISAALLSRGLLSRTTRG